jgi:hypothetical protein
MYMSLILVLIFKHYKKTLSTKKMADNLDSVNEMEITLYRIGILFTE